MPEHTAHPIRPHHPHRGREGEGEEKAERKLTCTQHCPLTQRLRPLVVFQAGCKWAGAGEFKPERYIITANQGKGRSVHALLLLAAARLLVGNAAPFTIH